MEFLLVASSLLWIALLLVPWRPWSTRERLEPEDEGTERNLSNITVLVPARNEASVIERTLSALANQGPGLQVILVDDQSTDETASLALSELVTGLKVIKGKPLPSGWTGKLWALEQGWRNTNTELVLLLDADIELEPRMIGTLKQKMIDEQLDLVSIMAHLRMETFWEKLLAPAFVYFFKLIYPFSIGNSPNSNLGVAAGGCILVRSDALRRTGAFRSIRNAIIDDCSLAGSIKKSGGRTWTGLLSSSLTGRGLAVVGVFAMLISYLPTLRYYRRSILWAPMLPFIGGLYLLMTWSSAVRYWRGQRSEWKGRVYAR